MHYSKVIVGLVLTQAALIYCGSIKNFQQNNGILSRNKRWEFQTFSVREGLRRKKEIAKLHSSADDGGDDVIYKISGVGVGSLFEVEPRTGKLYAISELDREVQSKYELRVS